MSDWEEDHAEDDFDGRESSEVMHASTHRLSEEPSTRASLVLGFDPFEEDAEAEAAAEAAAAGGTAFESEQSIEGVLTTVHTVICPESRFSLLSHPSPRFPPDQCSHSSSPNKGIPTTCLCC